MKRKTSPVKRRSPKPLPPTPADQCQTLESAGLLLRAPSESELEYLFRHALVQEAAYRSLLRQDRRRLHLTVGETLEALYPERLDELAPLLAQHFFEAGEAARALRYFALAGKAAEQVYANAEAVMHYTRALEIAKTIPPNDQADPESSLVHLYTHRGRVLQLNSQYPEAQRNYTEMQALAHERGDRPLELAALVECLILYSTPTPLYDPSQAERMAEQALSLARELNDRQAEAKILWNLMVINSLLNLPHAAVKYGEQSLVLARELGLREQLAFTLNDLYLSYMMLGRMENARDTLLASRAHWTELNNLPMLADSWCGSAMFHFFSGEYDQVRACAAEALRIGESIGNLWNQSYGRFIWGMSLLERGELGEARTVMEACIQLGDRAGFVMPAVGIRSMLAWMVARLGDRPLGFQLVRQALAEAHARLPNWHSWPAGVLARLLILEGDLAEAEKTIQAGYVGVNPENYTTFSAIVLPMAESELARARGDYQQAVKVMDELIAGLRRKNFHPYRAEALYLKSEALLAQGREDEAYPVLAEAHTHSEALGERWNGWRILRSLSKLEAKRGNLATAQAFQRQAREMVAYLAEQIREPELRNSFLNQLEVRAVLTEDRGS
jgi:tetratricopeptide (TPR) repeat protein